MRILILLNINMGGAIGIVNALNDDSSSDEEFKNLTYLQRMKLKKLARMKEKGQTASIELSTPASTLRPFRDLNHTAENPNHFRQRYKGEEMGPDSYGYYEGRGIYHLGNGHVYEGNVMHGKKHGFGILRYSNGAIYEGEYEHGRRCGKGRFNFENGNIYNGEWKDGKMWGKGEYFYKDGDRYEGDFVEDKFDGHGVYYYSNGDSYEGDFVLDLRHGKGKLTMKGRGIYEGDFYRNKITGRGVFTYWNAVEVDNNEAKDDGSSINTNNDTVQNHALQNGGRYLSYKGEWVDFKKHGKGELVFANGDVYTGDFRKDMRAGFGLMVFASGKRYSGEWKKDYPHGPGRVSYPNGEVYEGVWRHGVQIVFSDFSNENSLIEPASAEKSIISLEGTTVTNEIQ